MDDNILLPQSTRHRYEQKQRIIIGKRYSLKNQSFYEEIT